MAKVAIISDIHANLEALQAVIEDIDRQGIREIYCLGDVVGYGPDPVRCTDIVRSRCRVTICGNHEEALVKGAWGFSQHAREAIDWTRKMTRPRFYRWGSRARWRFLSHLPLVYQLGPYLLVHGSPRNPTSEYVLPRDVDWAQPAKFEEIFAAFETVCFVGHTHVAGVFTERPSFEAQSEIAEEFSYNGAKMLVNVGSVGQPRDGDRRACYLTIDEGRFRYHRVDYPWEVTRGKIHDIRQLDNRLGDRLGRGE